MNRRETSFALFTFIVVPRAVSAQAPARPARVGYLTMGSADSAARLTAAFKQRLRELGHAEGKNFVLDIRAVMGDITDVPAITRELVASTPDVIVTSATVFAAEAQKATSKIPIIAAGGDVASSGLVKNLARPEGNITGVSNLLAETSAKLLELALQINPRGASIAVLGNPAELIYSTVLKVIESTASSTGATFHFIHARSAAEIDGAFGQATRIRARAAIIVPSTLLYSNRAHVADQALRNRIATISWRREMVESGGLISYGSDFAESHRLAADFVDRILKGAKPADLPVQQPGKFELVVNLKTAKAIGITIPRDVLLRADVTIQ